MQGKRRIAPVILLPSLLVLAGVQALAAPPDAGQISQEPHAPLAPPSSAAPAFKIEPTRGNTTVPEGGPVVRIVGLRFEGNSAFDSASLKALLADAVDHELTFADLNRLSERVTRYYRAAGYLVARAYLPAQDLKTGVLEIHVLEGRLGQVDLRNNAGLSGAALAPIRQLPLDAPIQSQGLDQVLLTLADLPGTQVQSTLRPGQSLGASDLLVEVSRTRGFEGSADIDNFGSRSTGEFRLGTSLYWNNPLERGDQLSLRLQASDEQMHYERVAYQMPLGTYATRVGVALSDMGYHLGKDFKVLDDTGFARIASLYLRQGLQRSLSANWYGQLQFDGKRLGDDVGSTRTDTRQHLDNLVAGLDGDWIDGLGGGASNTLQLNVTQGHLWMDADSAAIDALSARSAGNFLKLEAWWQRVQALRQGLDLALKLSGQLANHNLASVEKMDLGGSEGVRAYAQGEALGDSGWLAAAELRWHVTQNWQAQVFGDAGGVRSDHHPWEGGSNERRLASAGLGANWAAASTVVTASAAFATDHELRFERRPRLWVQLTQGF